MPVESRHRSTPPLNRRGPRPRPTPYRRLPLVPVGLVLALAGLACGPPAVEVDALIAQLENRACRYSDDPSAPCSRLSFGSGWLRRFDPTSRYRCVVGAARCLEQRGPAAAAAVPALLRVLREGPNDYDTGDGVIPARTTVASALGAIGDPRAIDPLAEALRNAVPADRGPGALVSREPAAVAAIVEALGRFGPAAGRHWEPVAALLRSRASDTSYFETQREAFEQAEATRLVVEDLRRRDSTLKSFEVPPTVVARARRRIDRTSAAYRRDLETRSVDGIASTAARTLGRLGRTEAGPALIEALRYPPAAEAVAIALAELDVASPRAAVGLHAAFTSTTSGPAARRALARAMGALGDGRSVAVLARGLADPEACEACAQALGEFGPRAASALPSLYDVARQRSKGTFSDQGAAYSVEATQRRGNRIAAVRAVEKVGGRKAVRVLAPYWQDPDIGSTITRALRR